MSTTHMKVEALENGNVDVLAMKRELKQKTDRIIDAVFEEMAARLRQAAEIERRHKAKAA